MNSPRHSWMWAEACALIDQAEARHRHFYELLAAPAASPTWEPPANIFSLDADVWVEVALPGARLDDVRIQVGTTLLLIEAMVAPPVFPRGVNVVRLEIPYGRMRRRIELPPRSYVLREHRLENGYLFLRLSGGAL